jgi:ADP-ribose pyrophosphatase YjhB (NUDIX family)
LYPNCWEFPSGGHESCDKTLEETAIREVREEVNLNFKPTSKLNFYETPLKTTLIVSHIFLGSWEGEPKYNEREISDMGWFTYEETKWLDIAFEYSGVIEDLRKLDLI